MKTILLSFLFFTAFVNAQETEFSFTLEKGLTDFIITPVEGKTSAEIYKKTLDWIKETYKNPDKVILMTVENELIRFEGSSDSFYALNLMGKQYQNSRYLIEVNFKDGKYKFDLISIESFSQGWNKLTFFNYHTSKEFLDNTTVFKKDGTLRSTFKYLPEVPIYFNNLNKSLLESITTTVKKSDGW